MVAGLTESAVLALVVTLALMVLIVFALSTTELASLSWFIAYNRKTPQPANPTKPNARRARHWDCSNRVRQFKVL